MAKASRSRFVQQLWDNLALDSPDLCWHGDASFRISGEDLRARAALSAGGFSFRSLSSFVRQLSYYGFKRLSDRRRSSDRVPAAQSYIIFSHPSGHFNRTNREETSLIIRKLRARKKTTSRRDSSASSEVDLDDDLEGDAATPDDHGYEGSHQNEVHQPIYHEQTHQDSYSSSLRTNWPELSLPPRAPEHWQQSPYPSPLNGPFPSPLCTPSAATFGLPPQAYMSFNQGGPSSAPSYFHDPTAPTTIPPTLVEGKLDSSTHYHPTGLVGGAAAPPSPANSSGSDSNQQHQQQQTGFVSPAPAPSRTLYDFHPLSTSTTDHNSFTAVNPIAEALRKPPQYHDFSALYGPSSSND